MSVCSNLQSIQHDWSANQNYCCILSCAFRPLGRLFPSFVGSPQIERPITKTNAMASHIRSLLWLFSTITLFSATQNTSTLCIWEMQSLKERTHDSKFCSTLCSTQMAGLRTKTLSRSVDVLSTLWSTSTIYILGPFAGSAQMDWLSTKRKVLQYDVSVLFSGLFQMTAPFPAT